MSHYLSRGLIVLALLPALSGCAALVAGTVVGAGTVVALDRRTAGTLVEDQANEMKITDAIYRDEHVGKQVSVNVNSFGRVVLLTGEVPNEAMRDRVAAIARQESGLEGLFNQIRVAPRRSVQQRSRDAWITAKIKSKLLADNAKPMKNKVVTASGTVYLMGLVTQAEAHQAVEVARNVAGVQHVMTLYDYLDQAPTYAGTGVEQPAGTTAMDNTAERDSGAVSIPYEPQRRDPALVSGQ